MEPRVMMASQFKQQCLAVLDQVQRTGVAVVVTKHGRPVARLVPVEERRSGRSTMGSVELLADEDERYFSTGESWEASGPAR
ncbi:MAG: type II toxin-antitoxin system Phd/YefM family antitoxin [Acidimicrobiia bacterium]